MKDTQNVTIAILLVMAAVLAVMLIGVYRGTTQQAYGDTSIKQGDYIMVTGGISEMADMLYVVDVAARRMNAYALNRDTQVMEIKDTVDLTRAFEIP